MSKKFLVPIDMNNLEIQNFLVHNLATSPSGVAGKLYYNTADKKLYYYDGTTWQPIVRTSDVPSGVSPSSTTPKMDGTASVGTETAFARGDHKHPTDTSRVSTSTTINGKALTGNITLDADDVGAIYDDVILAYTSASNEVGLRYPNQEPFTSVEIPLATTSADGLLDSADKVKLNSLGDASEKGVDTSITTSSTSTNLPTSSAVASLVSSAISASDAMRFKGTLGTGGTVTALPTSNVKVGDTYRVITAGTYASIKCEVGDLIIATATTPTWTVAQTNIDGAVTASTTTTNGYLAKFTGDKVIANGVQLGSNTTTYLRNDGTWGTPVGRSYTAKTGKPTSNLTPSFGDSVTISQVSQSTTGQITVTDRTITIPSTTASTSANGLMSSAHYDALDDLCNNGLIWGSLTMASGQTSVSINCQVLLYMARLYNGSSNEEVVVDMEYASGTTTFSIAEAVSEVITIRYARDYSDIPI